MEKGRSEANVAVAVKQGLEGLRTNTEIRTYISQARRALQLGLATKPADDLPVAYKNLVYEALHFLAEKHLKVYFEEKLKTDRKAAIILLSYSSLLKQSDRRVTDLKPDHLSKADESLRDHIRRAMVESWAPISKRPKRLELHRLAQRPVSPNGGAPQRVPIYISAFEIDWTPDFELRGNFLYKRGSEDPVALYGFCPLNSSDHSEPVAPLRALVQAHANAQSDQDDRYPIDELPPEEYSIYTEYLRRLLLLNGERGQNHLCLCTIAISDDLSDVPLGTAMIFSETCVSPDVAAGIREICFDVFNAFYKIESEAFCRRETSLLLVNWVNHEAKNWAAGIRNLAEELIEVHSKKRTIEGLLETGEELKALATTIPLTTELLRQINLNTDPKTLYDFNNEVRQILRAELGKQFIDNYTCMVDTDLRLPRALLMICMELIRNVQKYNTATPRSDLEVTVTLKKINGSLILTVVSAPHNKEFSEHSLKQMNTESAATLNLEGTRQGAKLIKSMVEIMGGNIRWDWGQTGTDDNSIEVRVTCEVPVASTWK